MEGCSYMGVRTGKQYLEGLKGERAIYLEGEFVEDVTTHPRFARVAETIAKLYDLQHDPVLQDELTFVSPSSGERVGLSYIIPQDYGDLTGSLDGRPITSTCR
jgi:4-hydroxyphenylacetate 3-monooxygenase